MEMHFVGLYLRLMVSQGYCIVHHKAVKVFLISSSGSWAIPQAYHMGLMNFPPQETDFDYLEHLVQDMYILLVWRFPKTLGHYHKIMEMLAGISNN